MIEFQRWLVLTEHGGARMTARRPSLAADEIAIRLDLQVPRGLWRQPQIVARVRVGKEAVPPNVVSEEAISSLQGAFEQAGLRVTLAVEPDEG